MANGAIPVYCGDHQDVGAEIRTERLSEFDQFTEHRSTLKSDGSVCQIHLFGSSILSRWNDDRNPQSEKMQYGNLYTRDILKLYKKMYLHFSQCFFFFIYLLF